MRRKKTKILGHKNQSKIKKKEKFLNILRLGCWIFKDEYANTKEKMNRKKVKKPRCWRCFKYHNNTGGIYKLIPFGSFNAYRIYPTIKLPQPICDKCVKEFIKWIVNGKDKQLDLKHKI